ncbi:MAG: helix-turn-helix domain-containing protein [Anaerolineae bacterium]
MKTRILDAAERLMIRYGYSKTTISDIAQEAGISKGAVYLHYASKEALFEDLLLRASTQVMYDLARRLQRDSIGGTLAGFYSNALVSIAANPLTKALYSNDKRALGDFTRYMMNSPQYQPLMALGSDFVTRCQAEGLIRQDLSAKAVTSILVALRYGFLMLDEALPPQNRPALMTSVMRSVLFCRKA